MYLVPTETTTLRSSTILARPRDGDGKQKATCFWIFRSIAFQPTNLYTILIRIPPEKKRRYTSFSLGSLPQSCSPFFIMLYFSPEVDCSRCFQLVPSAQNGKLGVGMNMGCTVVFLFGAVLLLFGLHHGVQLDRIGAWGRGGGREGSICIGQVSF